MRVNDFVEEKQAISPADMKLLQMAKISVGGGAPHDAGGKNNYTRQPNQLQEKVLKMA